MFDSLILQPLPSNNFKILQEYKYEDITVPKGYITNGADVPRAFWNIIPPFQPKFLPAIVVHDYLCDAYDMGFADDVFGEMLLKIEDSFVTRSMINIVKFYHKMV